MPVSTLVPSVLFLLIISLSSRANAAQQCFAADGVDLKAAVNKYYAGNWAAADTEKYGSIEDWCTKFVTTMRDLFRDKHTFNSNISAWDTSSVTDMKYMFLQANAFNQDVSAWNTSSVNTMAAMFHASAFNQDVSAWDTSKVTEMYGMFNAARAFNQDISAWDTSKVTNMESMFSYASAFNQDLSVWDTSSVTNMISMFEEARAFNQNLCAWKDKFPYITAFQIFSDSGCTYKATPVQSNQGPFCAGSAADCQAYTVEGCPDEFEEGTDYEEGDKMSIISDGEDYGKIYKCKGWPYTGHCKSEAFSPLNTAQACGGEVCWPVAWTYEGGCTGTITPTGAPVFLSLPEPLPSPSPSPNATYKSANDAKAEKVIAAKAKSAKSKSKAGGSGSSKAAKF